MRKSLAALSVVLFASVFAPALASAAPAWKLSVVPSADYFQPGPEDLSAVYTIEAENVGDESTSSQVKLEDVLPAGLLGEAVKLYASPVGLSDRPENDLALRGLCPSSLKCEYPGSLASSEAPPIQPGEKLVMLVRVGVAEGISGPLADLAKVRGGAAGLTAVIATAENQAGSDPPLGFHGFLASAIDSAAAPYTQAGGHPSQLAVEFDPATKTVAGESPNIAAAWRSGRNTPVGDPRDVVTELPPGLIGNPQAVPTCSLAEFFARECPLRTVVGTVNARFAGVYQGTGDIYPLFNLQPSGAYPGELGYEVASMGFLLTATLRSGSDYGLDITNLGTPEVYLNHVHINTWGVPADPSHDALRGKTCFLSNGDAFVQSLEAAEHECAAMRGGGPLYGGPAETPEVPFLAMPKSCGGEDLTFAMQYNSWENPGEEARAEAAAPPVDGCSQVRFEPQIEVQPTTNLADSSSGLAFDLHVPQGCWKPEAALGFEGLCQSDLKEAVVRLPAGLSVNPSSANGLEACSAGQIGLKTQVGQTPAHFTELPAQCPDQSKIGTAEVDTPLLHNPLKGSVYLATPHDNPFGSLLAAYIVLEGEGVIVKLPGRIEADPVTGQLTGRFLENPQTPFEDFHLRFFGGARGDLRTPPACGTYTTTAALTPWSHTETNEAGETTEATPIAHETSSFETTGAAHEGEACPTGGSGQPNSPVFRAGTESPEAGKFTPFSFHLAREDGSQELAKIETTLPPGLVGKLAGVGECSEAQLAIARSREHEGGGAEEIASPSCPSSSEVGTVEVAAGAGPTPYYTKGKAYLAGPYKGAPLSLAIVTPAVAGPFDLGAVVVRTALYVDPTTAQIKAVSDQIPHILQGIPLDVRSITLKMDRPDFTLNPTNCSELGFTGAETSLLGAAAPLTQRFQVGGCSTLPFKPNLHLSLTGQMNRSAFPALHAVLTMKSGSANIAGARVTLPHSEFLAQAHIGIPCTRVQFAANACPKSSLLGFARAVTPLLDRPLEGPVYLRSSSHELPDLVADLNGQITVVLDGRVDSVNERLRNTFEVIPDAPVSKFVLNLKGGSKGLLENSRNLCESTNRAVAEFTGQNGKLSNTEPIVKPRGCHKHHSGKGHNRHHKPHKRR